MGGTYRRSKNGVIVEERGLGDAVAKVFTPVARTLRLPCIDPKTKELRAESGCAKRKAKLNELGKKIGL